MILETVKRVSIDIHAKQLHRLDVTQKKKKFCFIYPYHTIMYRTFL